MAKAKTQIQEFLNPKSMLTPGAAGGVAMLIANTLGPQFGVEPQWVGLTVSFLLGALVFGAPVLPMWQRFPYYVVNSLLIFCMANGANNIGVGAAASAARPHDNTLAAHEFVEAPPQGLRLVAAARAQSSKKIKDLCAAGAQKGQNVQALCEHIRQQAKQKADDARETVKTKRSGKGSFFKPWFKPKQ